MPEKLFRISQETEREKPNSYLQFANRISFKEFQTTH